MHEWIGDTEVDMDACLIEWHRFRATIAEQMSMFKASVTEKKNGNRISAQLMKLSTKLYSLSKKSYDEAASVFYLPSKSTCAKQINKRMRTSGHDPRLFKLIEKQLSIVDNIPFALQLDEMVCKEGIVFNSKDKSFRGLAMDQELTPASLFENNVKTTEPRLTRYYLQLLFVQLNGSKVFIGP